MYVIVLLKCLCVGSYVCVMCKHSYLLLLYAAVLLPHYATPGDPIVIQCIAIAMAATNTQCIYSGNSFLLQLRASSTMLASPLIQVI